MDGAAADPNTDHHTQPNIKADTVNLTRNANQVEARLVNVEMAIFVKPKPRP